MTRLLIAATLTAGLCVLSMGTPLAQTPRTHATSMLDMTMPEFEAAVAKTDIVLLPIGSIEEHGAHLPLSSDADYVARTV